MVEIIWPSDTPISLKSDLAAEFPVYFYIPGNKSFLLHSKSIKELLEDKRVEKPLEVSYKSISFLLQSGVVPHPDTIFSNIFILGIGDTVRITGRDNKIEFEYFHEFPFFNKYRLSESEMYPDEDYILDIVADAAQDRIDENKRETVLFHSAGKDSNIIALALARRGVNDILSVTQQSEGQNDESLIVKSIANKLGFRHKTLITPDKIEKKHLDLIDLYFTNIALPSLDKVVLAFPLYMDQMDFSDSNIIDGSGNDVYIGHIPTANVFNRQRYSKLLHITRPLFDKFYSENNYKKISLTRAEWANLNGLSYYDSNKLIKESISVYDYWKMQSRIRAEWDFLDIRADIWGTIIELNTVMRKTNSFCEVINGNLILPWANHVVADYFAKLPEKFLFDRRVLKNKLILRKILKERLDLDSDKVGKQTYSFDFRKVQIQMMDKVKEEILSCSLWEKPAIENFYYRLIKKLKANHRYSFNIQSYIQRIYILSAWYNKNRYVKR